MTSTWTKVLIFAAGALIGSSVTWYAVKGYYEKLANEEIESVKSMYVEKYEPEDSEQEELEIKPEETKRTSSIDLNQYKQLLESYKDKKEEEENKMKYEPQVISPEEFGDTGYTQMYLTYFADGVLADDFDDEEVEIEDTIGYEALKHFGEYEMDIVHVRNDERRCDYEVTVDERNYADVMEG